MSTPVEDMSETQLILELVLMLFDLPMTATEMTTETQEILARVSAREFEPTTH